MGLFARIEAHSLKYAIIFDTLWACISYSPRAVLFSSDGKVFARFIIQPACWPHVVCWCVHAQRCGMYEAVNI